MKHHNTITLSSTSPINTCPLFCVIVHVWMWACSMMLHWYQEGSKYAPVDAECATDLVRSFLRFILETLSLVGWNCPLPSHALTPPIVCLRLSYVCIVWVDVRWIHALEISSPSAIRCACHQAVRSLMAVGLVVLGWSLQAFFK